MTIKLTANFDMTKYKAALEKALGEIGKAARDTAPAVAKVAEGLNMLVGTIAVDAQTTKRAQATVYRNARNCVAGDELFKVGDMWVRFVELPDGVCVWLPEGRDVSAYLCINGIKPIRPGQIDTSREANVAQQQGEQMAKARLREQFPTPSEMRAREKLERTGQATPGSAVVTTPAKAQEIADRTLRDLVAQRQELFGSAWGQGVDLSPSDRDAELKQRLRPPAPRAKATLPEPQPARKRKLAKPEEEL